MALVVTQPRYVHILTAGTNERYGKDISYGRDEVIEASEACKRFAIKFLAGLSVSLTVNTDYVPKRH